MNNTYIVVIYTTMLIPILIVLLSTSAPIPPYRPPVPLTPAPGVYQMFWGGTPYRLTLRAAHYYEAIGDHGSRWWGSWGWDARTRTLHIQETADGEQWTHYSFAMQPDLSGVNHDAGCTIRISRVRR